MPLYEYRCEKCGRLIEFLESANSSHQHVCDRCGSKRMRKEMSACSVSGGSVGDGAGCAGGSPFR